MQEFQNMRNPILPLEHHVPDGEAHVMSDGKLYVYGSYDAHPDRYCSDQYRVISTPDLKHWTVHDMSFHGDQVPWFNNPHAPKYPGIDWAHPTPFLRKVIAAEAEKEADTKKRTDHQEVRKPDPALLFAPDCIERDGKYYLYFCMADDSEGVAVSDRPEGPFTDPVQLPCGGIDPAIFMDDDGQAYYYWGQLSSHGVKLNDDMKSFNQAEVVNGLVTEEQHFFHEGSSMRKIGDTYCYVYADMERGKPTALGYATSKSPLGPFAYQGIIIDNDGCDPESWNNHGSIECVNGQWYVFYHRSSRGTKVYRRLCVEPITINPDGSIDEVRMTSQGAGAPFAPEEPIYGYQACGMKGSVYIGPDDHHGEKLTNISAGDEAVFRYVRSENAWTAVQITCAGSGTLRVLLNDIVVGSVQIIGTAGSTKTVQADIQAPAGEYELTLRVESANNLEIMEMVLY